MPIQIQLAPNEMLLTPVGSIQNGEEISSVTIESGTKFLLGRDIIRESEANTSCKRLYVLIQVIYLSDAPFEAETKFMHEASVIMQTAPSMAPYITMIHQMMQQEQFHEALRCARELIAYEATVIERVMGTMQPAADARH